MRPIKPNGHEEIHVNKGEILLTKHGEFKICGKGELEAINAGRNITFNDLWFTYTDKEGKGHYRELNGWHITVYEYAEPHPEPPPEPTLEEKQITFFDLIGD